jgi:hypothetical protein
MSEELTTNVEKQNEIMELLHEGLRNSNRTLHDDSEYELLVQDLNNTIIQMQMNYLEGRI